MILSLFSHSFLLLRHVGHLLAIGTTLERGFSYSCGKVERVVIRICTNPQYTYEYAQVQNTNERISQVESSQPVSHHATIVSIFHGVLLLRFTDGVLLHFIVTITKGTRYEKEGR